MTPIVARCGYRCDLCPAYKENIHGPEDQQRTSDGWFKYYGFRIPPEQICCDGCRDERPGACRIDANCPIRPCVIARGMETCGDCPELGCKHFESRAVTRQSVEKRFGAPMPPEDYRKFVLPYERSGLRRDGDQETPMTKRTIQAGEPIAVKQAATRIVRELHALTDPRKAEVAQRFVATPIQALGIDAPTLRGLARDWVRRLQPTWHLREARALCGLLFQQPHIETRAAGFLVLGGFSSEFDPGLCRQAERWLNRYLDNWALVDGFASSVLSPLLQRYPECSAELRRWIKSKCMWTRRAVVVTLVPFARHGEQLALAFELAESLLEEKEDLMHKAVGWLLREAGKTNPRRLKTFLLHHRGAVPRTTVRYAIERFSASERKRLLKQTRR